MPKTARSNSMARHERRHNPLSEEYSPTTPLKQKAGKKRKQSHGEENAPEGYVDSKASRRILDLGQGLADEDEAEREAKRPATASSVFDGLGGGFPRDVVSDEEGEGGVMVGEYDNEEAWGSEEEVEEIEVDPQDLDTFNKFNPSFDPATLLNDHPDAEEPPTNLADLILSKIAAHEARQQQNPSLTTTAPPNILGGGPPEDAILLPPKVIEVYTQIATLLSRYKSGKLPKPFKILPSLPLCQTLLSITSPENWTPNAVYEATKLFVSAHPALAQAFCADILLPRVREDILENKKLNVHLYKALKKSLYKPAAFFRGLVFPLVASGTCTLREAAIVASGIARVSIPVLHSATALFRLCEIGAEQMLGDVESAGACCVLIRTLLEKRYALPYRVVDALVFHFLRFRAVQSAQDIGMSGGGNGNGNGGMAGGAMEYKLPVLWHQCLLAFAQRYKNEITEDQREALLDLLLVRGHRQIGPEVRRELLEGRGRGVMVEPARVEGGGREGEGAAGDGDDTMMGA
ncbi:snoRNA-binding rRNA-processing protein [Friedmanniomyces endolithicus]|uniref:SnoRNA-binding rRNA-processing protein n=1 Tax=Friedmanniomyces endolithicus TaxID=329885 RepID=A0AAN6R0K6_9PEZI|nr:snoRNA-binding rRNA-processing protein [Friedmanniomyces endolithicus]KAK0277676.1 snoRNA-binding rRNA-processing protein [Friedmanniomyces endolithicus]KAK0318254.1 snoRNA-binding rRNA-processing protein [Friedmanniomyces endolithicus]KAK0930865.1 snoRNA-binding rRNA-processing protein [Friedmanniomyces endolithicus]KAK0982017.1 snoRNA-binding rRNA-processing protein [Friedmanniomyces endolithicus]